MDAQEMMVEVVGCEQKLKNLVQREFNKEIKILIDKTGLDVTGVNIDFMDTTSIGDVYKQLMLLNIDIQVKLPDKFKL